MKFRKTYSPFPASSATIPVYWNVIYANKTLEGGYMPEAQITESIDVINKAYLTTGLSFTLESFVYTHNKTAFRRLGPGNKFNDEIKQGLRQGGSNALSTCGQVLRFILELNFCLDVYTVGFEKGSGEGLLGYATFPRDYESKASMSLKIEFRST